ncbi:MAG: VWA domain-containing protein [Planctomycetes bacterium]|nr:VWA domain-containing protein [Planctomycetota bacterium]
MFQARRSKPYMLVLIIATCLVSSGCGRRPPPAPRSVQTASAQRRTSNLLPPISLPQPSQRLGTAVVILIDTSGSMQQTVRDRTGHPRPKFQIASGVLTKIIHVTDEWHTKHTDSPLFMGISSFSSGTSEVLKIGPFDATSATNAVAAIPHPAGGTAIGKALAAGFESLYSTGCVRKHLICITDGNNTVGTPPDLMARQLYSQTHGDVEMHFVAFDTAASHFGFLSQTGGSVVVAADENQLQARLTEIYEKRIFAEAMPAEKE